MKYEDIIGEKFNRLTLKEIIEERDFSEHIYGIFECECGNTKKIAIYNVIKGVTRSCGCLRKEHMSELGKLTRKHKEECTLCGKKQHYAKGLCKNCYYRERWKKEHE